MLRLVPALAFGFALLLAGCAFEATPQRAKAVTVLKTRSCTTTIRPDETLCESKRKCKELSTCAEAYYRYTTCKHLWLDGGTAVPRIGQPNGIPCEEMCKRDALVMAKEIRDKPFSPPTRTSTVCDPAKRE